MYINARGDILNDNSLLYNGQGSGVGATLLAPQSHRLDPGFWQPYYDSKGRTCVELRTGNFEVTANGKLEAQKKVWTVRELRARGIDNAVWNTATLRKDQWIQMQERVVMATRLRLSAWTDLYNASKIGGFNAWAKLTYEYQATNDPGEAVKDMDGLSEGRTDRPLFNLVSVPLPITHSDFWFSDREIEVSRSAGMPLNTRMAEAAGRRIGELTEQTLIGTATGLSFGPTSGTDTRYTGTSTEYGYTNYPYRVTKTDLHTPSSSAPENILGDVQAMMETMYGNGFYGPFILYHSTPYSIFLNGDYFRTGGTTAVTSVRARLMQLEGLTAIRRLDYLTSGYQLILVQMDPEYMAAIEGMPVNVMAWESRGGLKHNYVAMGIMVGLLMSPYSGISPIVHGTTS